MILCIFRPYFFAENDFFKTTHPTRKVRKKNKNNMVWKSFLSKNKDFGKKNKLLLNEYLGDFMHFETIFFFAENDFFKPSHPTKVRKIPHFFFETFPNT